MYLAPAGAQVCDENTIQKPSGKLTLILLPVLWHELFHLLFELLIADCGEAAFLLILVYDPARNPVHFDLANPIGAGQAEELIHPQRNAVYAALVGDSDPGRSTE